MNHNGSYLEGGEEGVAVGLAEIEFLNGKGLWGLKKWFRARYMRKILQEIGPARRSLDAGGDHPYNNFVKRKGGDPREYIIPGTEENCI
jgi:hypothetical protein